MKLNELSKESVSGIVRNLFKIFSRNSINDMTLQSDTY